MIIIKIIGGIGNQMFQYAYAYSIAKKINSKLFIDLSEIKKINTDVNFTIRKYELNHFNISASEISPFLIKIFKFIIKLNKKVKLDKLKNLFYKKYKISIPVFTEYVYFGYNYIEKEHLKFTYIEGYFQSYDYFKDYENDIRNIFTHNLNQIFDQYDYSNVAVHVRRGDYANNLSIMKVHGLCTISYYESAFDFFHQHHNSLNFYIFSDSLNEVKNEFKHLSKKYNLFYCTSYTNHSAIDLLRMSKFNHIIIANSSYSWWSAWLNDNPNKIIVCPSKWVNDVNINNNIKDLVPPNWKKI
jgi:hypothetical protein